MNAEELKETVREKYGLAALRATEGAKSSCCGGSGSCGTADPITSNLYAAGQTALLPEAAVLASLGCGNPTALTELKEGEVVLDLGSGGGIDVLLSAHRVGPTGKAYGLDMTDEMLALARANATKAGATNVEFLKGDIEAIPLPDASVDVIISNCVINLAADKSKVLAEAFRVLKPGGRFAVSDVVIRGEVPAEVRQSMELWVGCVAGALTEEEFIATLRDVGFDDPSIEPTRVYEFNDAKTFLGDAGLDSEVLAREVGGRVMGAFVRATKPALATLPFGAREELLWPGVLPLTAPLRWRVSVEALGTFFLVLIGPGAAMADAWSGGRVTHVGVALAFAFVVTAVLATLGPVSGAHINPAVSVAATWRGKLRRGDLLPYVVAQLAGAVVAAALLRYLLGPVAHNGATLPEVGISRAFVLEALMSLALGLVAFRSRGALAPLAIGLTVGFCALMGGPLTGASMNPARTFGPALIGGEWAGHWLYWIAPVMGMMLAAAIDRGLDPSTSESFTARAE